MERLQEELEGSQQECCENVSGCYDDVFFFVKMLFFDSYFAASIRIGKFESPTSHLRIFFF